MAIGCAGPSSRVGDYLVGFQSVSGRPQIAAPLVVGLLIVLPEEELAKPTTPSKEVLEKIGQRIQKELQESRNIKVRRIFPAIITPGAGLGAVSLERIRESVKDPDLPKVIVAVATSRLGESISRASRISSSREWTRRSPISPPARCWRARLVRMTTFSRSRIFTTGFPIHVCIIGPSPSPDHLRSLKVTHTKRWERWRFREQPISLA